MSFAVNGKINPVLVRDPKMRFESGAEFAVNKAAANNTYRVLPTQNYSSNGGNVVFNAQPPSENIAISRRVLTKFYFQVDFTGVAGANGRILDIGLYDAPRQFPIAQCTTSMSATINNATVNLLPYQVIPALTRCNVTDIDISRNMSLAPSMPDSTQNYSDVYTATNNTTLGVANDPLQSGGQNSFYQTRGGWEMISVTNPNVGVGVTGTAQVKFSSTEPLYVSPFLSKSDEYSLLGVQTLTVNFNMANLFRCWSHSDYASASTISSAIGSLYAPPEIHLNYLTPSPLQPIPSSIVFNYSNIDVYQTDNPVSIAANGTFSLPSNNIQLNTIPKRIVVFARRNDSTTTVSTTDSFAALTSLSINFDNQSGILSGASQEQLWLMSRESGLNLSWTEFSKTVGSVMILDLPKTLALQNDTEAPSLQISKQLQITAGFKNINPTNAVTFSMYILVISDGLITITDGVTIQQNSVLSTADILNVANTTERPYHVPESFYGSGNFLKSIKKGKFISKAANIADKLGVPGAKQVHEIAKIAGVGLTGSALTGGRSMSKSALKSRMVKGRGFEQEYESDDE